MCWNTCISCLTLAMLNDYTDNTYVYGHMRTSSAYNSQVVQEGAALAPAWTEAMFHELLDQEASPASDAALHHAADIMSLYDTAKASHCMAGMQQGISGKCKHAAPCSLTIQHAVTAFLSKAIYFQTAVLLGTPDKHRMKYI